MKRFTNILVALGVTLFLLTVGMKSDAEAQTCCPSPLYTQVLDSAIHPISGCKFYFKYCYYNAPGGDRKVTICDIIIPIGQSCNFSLFILDGTFWDLVYTEIARNLDIDIPFIPCPFIGGQTNLLVEYSKAYCYKLVNDILNQQFVFAPCDSEPGLCRSEYTICKDEGDFQVTRISGPTVIVSGNCEEGIFFPDFNSPPMNCFSTCY